jgi:hypothetical protein
MKIIKTPKGLLIILAKLQGILNGNRRKMTKITKLTISIFFNGFLKEAKFAENFIEYMYRII